jgi:hypothetical protein
MSDNFSLSSEHPLTFASDEEDGIALTPTTRGARLSPLSPTPLELDEELEVWPEPARSNLAHARQLCLLG